ncbi:unnamed protein product [Rhizoctonia solani]|uniref:Uncharacterized protein n=1 Tax=Rhizoctonia solani TaxID=456999 RepID=A0A8H3HUJ6_9AGAM|nr:unnamed protein product [Rhizoctonia solani]
MRPSSPTLILPERRFGRYQNDNELQLEYTSIHNIVGGNEKGVWELSIIVTWLSYIQPDIFGYEDFPSRDMNGDGVMDRLAPNSTTPTIST